MPTVSASRLALSQLKSCHHDTQTVRLSIYSIVFCSSRDAVGDATSNLLVVPDNAVKLCVPQINRSRNIRLQVIGSGIFDSLFRENVRLEVASDVISGVVVDTTVVIQGQTFLEIFGPLTL